MNRMQHPERHTLELYAAGAASVKELRQVIATHLRRCPACAEFVRRQTEFYSQIDDAGKPPELSQRQGDLALMGPARRRVQNVPPMPIVTRWEKPTVTMTMLSFFHSNRLISSAGGLVIIGLLAWLAVSSFDGLETVSRLEQISYNLPESLVIAYSTEGEKLWQRSVLADLGKISQEEGLSHIDYTVVADLDGDGAREVVTGLPLRMGQGGLVGNAIHILGASADDAYVIKIGTPVSFGGETYASPDAIKGIVVVEGGMSGHKEILACATGFRSPTVVGRVAATGDVLGEYWHYGHLSCVYRVQRIDGLQGEQVLLLGRNDAQDSLGIIYPVLAVLDPQKVAGKTECAVTRGFGFEQSTAELFYVRLPMPDVAVALGQVLGPSRLIGADDSTFTCLYSSAPEPFAIEYTFSNDMSLKRVKPVEGYGQLHKRLRNEGRVSSSLDAGYFEDLRLSVRYWSGGQWQKRAQRIR